MSDVEVAEVGRLKKENDRLRDELANAKEVKARFARIMEQRQNVIEQERDELKSELAEVWVSHTKLEAKLEAVTAVLVKYTDKTLSGRALGLYIKMEEAVGLQEGSIPIIKPAATEGGGDE